jgi:hypothetical protein
MVAVWIDNTNAAAVDYVLPGAVFEKLCLTAARSSYDVCVFQPRLDRQHDGLGAFVAAENDGGAIRSD